MKHQVPHDLDAATARRVVDHAFEAYKVRFPDYRPSIRWPTPAKALISFSARGLSMEGSIELAERAVSIELDVPLLLRPLRGKAIDTIEREIRKWIEKAKTGQV